MKIKVKFPHLLKFSLGLLQAALAFYLLYHFNFLNLIAYSILLVALEAVKKGWCS
jgi:hypothetical protein